MLLLNNASGGSNGATVDNTNASGYESGRAWEAVGIGPGATLTFSNTQARGNLSYKFTTTATTTTTHLDWTISASPVTTVYSRLYLFMPTLPATSFRVFQLNDTSTTPWMTVGINSTGKVVVRDSTTAAIFTATSSLPTNKWIRMEFKCVSHATAGQVEAYIFHDADSTHHVEKRISSTTFNTTGNPLGTIIFGNASQAIANYTFYMDDLGVSDGGYLGPVDPTYISDKLMTNSAESGTNGAAAVYTNTGGASGHYIYPALNGAGTVTFSNAQAAHGTLSYAVQAGTGDTAKLDWQPNPTTTVAMRAYFYVTSLPSVNTVIMAPYSGISVMMAGIGIDTTGKVFVRDTTGTTIWTSTASISANSWYRLELAVIAGATTSTGTINAAFYPGDSATASDSYSTNTANTTTSTCDLLYFGKISSNSWSNTFYMDDLAARPDSSTFIGPYSASYPSPGAYSVIPPLGWGHQI